MVYYIRLKKLVKGKILQGNIKDFYIAGNVLGKGATSKVFC